MTFWSPVDGAAILIYIFEIVITMAIEVVGCEINSYDKLNGASE